MDLIKTGNFLKELRKEKGLTQEQLAEQMGVARRTVSRWETGMNMPDLDLLTEMAEFYQVDLREIMAGERKDRRMDEEMKETVIQVAEYSNADKQRTARIMQAYSVIGMIALIVNAGMNLMEIGGTFWTEFIKGATFALALIAMLFGFLFTTGTLQKVQAFKQRLMRKMKGDKPTTYHRRVTRRKSHELQRHISIKGIGSGVQEPKLYRD